MITLQTERIKMLSDLTTPVGLLIKLREHFPQILLLESADYSSRQDSRSFLFMEPLATMEADDSVCRISGRGLLQQELSLTGSVFDLVEQSKQMIQCQGSEEVSQDLAWVGYTGFEMSTIFLEQPIEREKESRKVKESADQPVIPGMRYDLFRYTIMIDHFREIMEVTEYRPSASESGLRQVMDMIGRQDVQPFRCTLEGEEWSELDDAGFLANVHKAKEHCQRGDVFQLVLSRRYCRKFRGDELEVYRHLRSVNPSPYLFYFDYGSFRIFGSSPEAQIRIQGGMAEVHPIAGTIKRTGDDRRDRELAMKLLHDAKENAEHVMLVDLARNDLSKHCSDVSVASYRDVQYFSHVIHLVSKVTGKIKPGTSSYKVFADSFPAGTLSGAPKLKALELIQSLEPGRRGFYGGGIGMIKWNGDLNHAILIRSFCSQRNTLYYQAGAGIVIGSTPENELKEVHNKLGALRLAMQSCHTELI